MDDVPRKSQTIGLILLGGLLLMRVAFLGGVGYFFWPSIPVWMRTVYENGTYLLTACLMWWERKRLLDFFIGKGALGIFIFGPILEPVVYRLLSPISPLGQDPLKPRWFQIAVGIVLLVAFIMTKTKIKKIQNKTITWLVVAVGLGAAAAALLGFLMAKFQPMTENPEKGSFSLAMLCAVFVSQLTRAAVDEEPLFRGFLWGFLRKAGWHDAGIWLFQAGLFMVSHIYYFGRAPISFWIVVPVSGLVMGFVAWRSRSIANSMVSHGLVNALGSALRSLIK